MIKIVGYKFDGGNFKVEVQFTTGNMVGDPPSPELDTRYYSRPILQVVQYTPEQIKGWIIGRIENARKLLQQSNVQNLFDPLVNVDIEE